MAAGNGSRPKDRPDKLGLRLGRGLAQDRDIVDAALNPVDRHLPFFLVWDEQHHRKYGLGLTPPGGEYPEEFVSSADDLVTLGSLLGVDGSPHRRMRGAMNERIVTSTPSAMLIAKHSATVAIARAVHCDGETAAGAAL